MNHLPGGTVTFLLTDIVASTRLWDQEPEQTQDAVERHDALFDASVETHAGVVVRPRGEGDSRFAVFPRASDAVAAVSEFQQAVYIERWPTSTPLRVRLALHTGEAALRGGDYYGSAVNRCARLRGLAYGGQALLTLTTARLVRDHLPPGVALRDLGEHALRDLTDRERVFQLVISGVPSDFPPLASPGRRPNNLPAQTTTFVGRAHEIETIRRQLLDPSVRLVTLVGAGGAGKTRLSLQVASDVLDAFEDGVYVVSLANVQDPDLVIAAIGQALGLREVGSQRPLAVLQEHLRERRVLLVLDNVEHVLEAVPEIAELLAGCPHLKILMTSRAAVPLRGSREVHVPPLDVPARGILPSLERLLSYAAIRLFVERARDVKPDFELTTENAATVIEICRRLDGLPLAIELAAARMRIFTPPALLARLRLRLPLLTGGARDLPTRQRTLRETIDWSHDLLDEHDRAVFRRLAVFAGSFTLTAAEVVLRASESDGVGDGVVVGDQLDDPDVLTGVDALVAQSLLYHLATDEDAGEPRFGMLETIREYGIEQLAAHGEAALVHRRHAAFFLDLAETGKPELSGGLPSFWLERVEADHDNLRAALDWSLQAANPSPEIGLRLAGALWPFWEYRGYLHEGRRWLEQAMSRAEGSLCQSNLLTGAGTLAWAQGDYGQARHFHTEALRCYEQLGEQRGVAFATNNLGVQAVGLGEFDRARALFERSLELYHAAGDQAGIADELSNLGALAQYEGDLELATRLAEESLAIRRALGDRRGVADTLYNLGDIAYARHDEPGAAALYRESLAIRSAIGERAGVIHCVAALAAVAADQCQLERAAMLCGAADQLLRTTGISLDDTERTRLERVSNVIHRALDEHTRADYWSRGQDMPFEVIVRFALTPAPDPDQPDAAVTDAPTPATSAAAPRDQSPWWMIDRRVAVTI